jgi:hypothetical protein
MEYKEPLGYIELETGLKEITPMTDVFANYTFENKEHWESLKTLTNILYAEYNNTVKNSIKLIEGPITVTTQYPHFKNPKGNSKKQDTKIDSKTQIEYIEFQNDLRIDARDIQYLGFSFSRGKDNKPSNHVWLLTGDVPSLLHGQIFSRYKLLKETDYKAHPNSSSILHINLRKLSLEKTKAGELARVLLGKTNTATYEDVKLVLNSYKLSFEKFKNDKEVKNIMSILQERELKGEVKGFDKGLKQGMQQGMHLIAKNMIKEIGLEASLNMYKEGKFKAFGINEEIFKRAYDEVSS